MKCAAQHERADCVHQAHLLGNRNKGCRRDNAAAWMGPSQQRLDTHHSSAMRRDNGLIVQFQLMRADRARQLTLDELQVGRDCIDRMIKGDDGAWSLFGCRT